ncbi:caspase family protein [Mucilaginibacter rubeus]|nr:caspase family protein [Mucilaginibacter rubeus]
MKNQFNLLLALLCVPFSSYCTPKTYALLIGMNKINVQRYATQYGRSYNNAAVAGVQKDLGDIQAILRLPPGDVKVLKGEDATHEDILAAMERIGGIVKPGDMFIFYYSGHGDTIPDINHDERNSKYDQVLVAYDQFVVDDEIDVIMRKYFTKTINCFMMDCCHSGTTYKFNSLFLDFKPVKDKENKNFQSFAKSVNKQQQELANCTFGKPIPESYSLIYFGATADEDLAIGNEAGGLLTRSLLYIFNVALSTGQWEQYNYRKLACEVRDLMAGDRQALQYHEIGTGTDQLALRKPFNN